MTAQAHIGMPVGRWKLTRPLGEGGNARVWVATDPTTSEQVAIKWLIKRAKVARTRFCDEVRTMKEHAGTPGVLPVLDSAPLSPDGEQPLWFAMPLATPLTSQLTASKVSAKVQAIAEVAETFASLHAKGWTHRDVKPNNLLYWNDRACAGDFGLADFPKKADITGSKDDLGPRWTVAPEVRRHDKSADPRKSDVYSLAKTLWILVTGQRMGFDGSYHPESVIGLSNFLGRAHIGTLDALLMAATDHDWKARPDMTEFASALREWIRIESKFDQHNAVDWEVSLRRLFPMGIPARASWTECTAIEHVLRAITRVGDVNHLFFPRADPERGGGGHDLDGVETSKMEPGCLELLAGAARFLIKPASLSFDSFGADLQWAYFRLEAAPLQPTGLHPGIEERQRYEAVTCVGGRTYADADCWEEREFDEKDLPPGSYPIDRYFGGSFVIFRKACIYNRDPGTYDARHDRMTPEDFRHYIGILAGKLSGLEPDIGYDLPLPRRLEEEDDAIRKKRATASRDRDKKGEWEKELNALFASPTGVPEWADVRYTVDASARFFESFRLCEDGSFRELGHDLRSAPGDKVFTSLDRAYERLASFKEFVKLGGARVPLSRPRDVTSLTDKVASLKVRVHRATIPATPTAKAVREAIAARKHKEAVCLVVELDGTVRVVPFTTALLNRPAVAVRTESFPGLGRTGTKPASDDEHIETILSLVLNGWLQHLARGELGAYSDYASGSSKKLAAEIEMAAAGGRSPFPPEEA